MGHNISTQIGDSALVAKTTTNDGKLIHGYIPIKPVSSYSLFSNYVFLITHGPTQILFPELLHA